MFKKSFAALLALTAFSATADTIFIKDIERAISTNRIFDEQNYILGSYEARIIGETVLGSSHPFEKVDIRLRTLIEYYGDELDRSEEIVRSIGAEACINMANQLRLSSNTKLALKITLPSVGDRDAATDTRSYLIDHKDGSVSHHHMKFECELVAPPGPILNVDTRDDLTYQEQSSFPTRY